MRRTLTGNGAGIAGGNTFKRATPAARPCCSLLLLTTSP